MKTRKILALVLALVMCVTVLAACGSSSTPAPAAPAASTTTTTETKTETPAQTETKTEAAPTYSFIFQPSCWQENGFWADGVGFWADYITEATDGRIKATRTAPGSICSTDQQLDAVSDGMTPAMAIASAYWAGVCDIGYTFATPPVVQSVDDMKDLMETYQDGRAGELWKSQVEGLYNVKVVGFIYGPASVPISSKKPINGINDLKGLKIRVGAGAIANALEYFGASCVYAPSSESYTMLSNGTIDAVITGSASDNKNASFDEVTSYWTRNWCANTTHAVTVVVNRDIWDQLSAEDQQALIDGCDYATEQICSYAYDKIDEAWAELEAEGINMCMWTDEDAETWARQFYEQCKSYSDSAEYTEFMQILYDWSVENGYFSA